MPSKNQIKIRVAEINWNTYSPFQAKEILKEKNTWATCIWCGCDLTPVTWEKYEHHFRHLDPFKKCILTKKWSFLKWESEKQNQIILADYRKTFIESYNYYFHEALLENHTINWISLDFFLKEEKIGWHIVTSTKELTKIRKTLKAYPDIKVFFISIEAESESLNYKINENQKFIVNLENKTINVLFWKELISGKSFEFQIYWDNGYVNFRDRWSGTTFYSSFQTNDIWKEFFINWKSPLFREKRHEFKTAVDKQESDIYNAEKCRKSEFFKENQENKSKLNNLFSNFEGIIYNPSSKPGLKNYNKEAYYHKVEDRDIINKDISKIEAIPYPKLESEPEEMFTLKYEKLEKDVEIGDYIIEKRLNGKILPKKVIIENYYSFQVEEIKRGKVMNSKCNNSFLANEVNVISEETFNRIIKKN